MFKPLFFLISLSLALRLLALNQSLWLDETISANVVKHYSYSQIISTFSPTDFHPPLFYLTLKAWTSVFGYSEISLRLPSVIFSLITIILVFNFFGFWPSLLLATNPLYLYYSQEARMYSLATLLVFCAFVAFKNKKIFLYFIFTFLSLSTFYGSVFFFAAVSLYWLVKKDSKNFYLSLAAIIWPLLFWSPLLLTQWANSQVLRHSVLNWSSVLGPANLKNLLLIPIKFTLGRLSFYPKIVYYLVALVLTLPLWFLLFLKSFRRRSIAFLFWITLLVGFVFSLFTPMFQYFRFLYLLPFLAILLRKSFLYLHVFLIFSLIYLINPAFHREDWKSLSATLPDTIYMIPSAADPIKYYRPDITVKDLSLPVTESSITVIPYLAPVHGLNYQAKLTTQNFTQVSTASFRELTTEIWSRQSLLR